MSAILGIVRFDGGQVERSALIGALDALAPFGPDGRDSWVGEGAALGHLSLRTTPEDAFDRQPLVGASGSVLAFAGRVDNRDDLSRTLGLKDDVTTPDSALVLAAYERLGGDFPREIVGDFALALWDPRARTLILARDPCGLQSSLFYSVGRGFLAFGTLPAALFPFGVPREADRLRLAQFVCEHDDVEYDRTAYEGVLRLLPGHRLVASDRGHRVDRFFEFDLGRTLRLGSDEAYVEAFLETYQRAVKAQLRAAGPIGVLMSGGRDSTSVAALAARRLDQEGKRLHAFTWAPEPGLAWISMPGRVLDEAAPAAKVAAEYPAIEHHVYNATGRTIMDVLAWQKRPFELPTIITNRVWMDAGLQEAGRRGIRVMLTGQFGNASVSWEGDGWLAGFVRRGQITRAVAELRRNARGRGIPLHIAFRRQVLLPLFPALLWLRHRSSQVTVVLARPLLDELGATYGWAPTRYPRWRTPIDDRDERANIPVTFHSDGVTACLGAYGVEWRDPTSDRRLRELSLAIPTEQHIGDGRGVGLLRRAMRGALPPEILDGPKVGLQGGDFVARFERAAPLVRACMTQLRGSAAASAFFDWQALEAFADTSKMTALPRIRALGRMLSAGIFLESLG